MYALITLICVLFLSLIVVRVAAVALTLTGISREAAQFQARSAWTGTGFTTDEAEAVVGHPVRRRIISVLMLLRSAGLITAASTLVLSFVNVGENEAGLLRVTVLLLALIALYLFARSGWVARHLEKMIGWALKIYGGLEARDYADLLHLAGEYGVLEMRVKKGSWLADTTLDDLDLPEEGVLVLGISKKDGTYIGAPSGEDKFDVGDTALIYGRGPVLSALGERRKDAAGDMQHAASVEEQHEIEEEEENGAPEEIAPDGSGDAPEEGGGASRDDKNAAPEDGEVATAAASRRS